jgi:hypothetical protein
MSLSLKKSGLLPEGTHTASWQEFISFFAYNEHRQNLVKGLVQGLKVLYQYGCLEVYIAGSFVTSKASPADVDVCYENSHMDWNGLKKAHPEFFDSKYGSKRQKKLYQSEFYPCNSYEDYFYNFFQTDRENNPKGMVRLYLKEIFKNDKKREAI